MYFITERKSHTGSKFRDLEEKLKLVSDSHKQISNELGFTQYRKGYWTAFGGISAIIFDNPPDTKTWKNVNGSKTEWMPRLNSKAGKELQKKLDSVYTISINELNMCIGFKGAPFKTIGYSSNNETYFGFVVGDDWGVKIPNDCKEVTVTEYKEIFKD